MESTSTLNLQLLKSLIKESVREVLHEEWFKFFEMIIPYVDDDEQADIVAKFSPTDYADQEFIDVTHWFENESQAQ